MTDSTQNLTVTSKVYNLAVVPKETINPFYAQVYAGCTEQATVFGDHVKCIYTGPDHVNATEQAEIVRDLISSGTIDGISMAVIDVAIATELAQEAFDKNIPFITFDSDAPESKRLMYVGTDNVAFGESLGKVLLQVKPEGGRFGVITAAPPNLVQRVEGLRKRLKNSKWIEVDESPKDCLDSNSMAQAQMYEYSRDIGVNAIVPVGGWAMRDVENWKKYVDTYRNITHVVADTDPEQLDLMAKVYVDGLVGQVPYQMGSLSVAKLLQLSQGNPVKNVILPTSLVEVIQIPLLLPAADLDYNYIGNLKIVGYVMATIVILLSIGFSTWTLFHRNRKVIKASQPCFLGMILFGVLLMGSSIIPLSFDDSKGGRGYSMACMAVPWLLCLGFCVSFSALFSKTWRINRIFQAKNRFVKVQVTERDVLVPFALLVFLNVLVLSLWTTLAPLHYVRKFHPGTDDWNRFISSYGLCSAVTNRMGGAVPYLISLGVINFGVIIMANIQAYRARSIQSEFSESKYIALVMASFLQSACIGGPILFLVQDNPQAFYLVMVFMVFLTCMSILLLIFIPKVRFVRMYSEENCEDHAVRTQRQQRQSLPSSAFFEKPAKSLTSPSNSSGANLSAPLDQQSSGEFVNRSSTLLECNTEGGLLAMRRSLEPIFPSVDGDVDAELAMKDQTWTLKISEEKAGDSIESDDGGRYNEYAASDQEHSLRDPLTISDLEEDSAIGLESSIGTCRTPQE